MHFALNRTASAVAIAATAALTAIGPPAMAFSIVRNNNSSDLLNALLGNTAGLSNFTVTATGNPDAFGLFSADPFGLESGIVLSTGKVVDLAGENTIDRGSAEAPNQPIADLNTDFGALGAPDDTMTLDISFDADSTAEKLFFQYVFGSEEFKEWGGSEFNDSFELLLNGANLAKLSAGQAVAINNLVPTPSGPYHPDYIDNPAAPGTATRLDGYTKVLGFEGLLNKNSRNTLSIVIKDLADGYLDSAVFLKGASLGTAPPPESVPEPSVVLGLFAVGGIAALNRRKKQKHLDG